MWNPKHEASTRRRVFDVGANLGEYAESVLSLWCFEPSPSTFQVLERRIAERPEVTVENLGLSNVDGSLTLHTLGQGSKVASVYQRRTDPQGLRHTEQVRVQTLDSYCAANGIRSIDLLKLDVEGHELSVLQGAKELLEARAIHFIQFEFSAACVDARVFFRDFWDLLSADFRICRMLKHGLAPITAYDETLEVFKRATNYLAERRGAS
jgi:FkbM family methyltransferase